MAKKILVQNQGRFQQLQSGDNVDTFGLFATGTTLDGLAAAPSITGFLAQPVAGTAAGRTLTGTAGNISITNGDGTTGNPIFDLVNAGTAVTDQFVSITTDAKGRVTATAAVSNANVTTALGYTPVNKAGDTDVGSISLSSGANLTVVGGGEVLGLPAIPATAGSAVSKAYVDGIAAGVNAKEAVRLATVAVLPSVTSAGSGVGHTLTATANDPLSIDGTAAVAGNRVLVKNQDAADDNGVYVVTDAGSAGTPFILTRATDFDGNPSNEVTPGDFVHVLAGLTLANTGWIVIGIASPIIVDNDNITWTQYTGAGSVSIIFAVTAGSNYTASSGSTVTIASTINQITATGDGTGTITLTTPQDIHTGASPTFVGATLSGRTANQVLYTGAGGAVTSSSAVTFDPTNGAFNVLPASIAGSPSLSKIQAGSSSTADGGNLWLYGGDTTNVGSSGGQVKIQGGGGSSGGNLQLEAGLGYSGNGGNILITAGQAADTYAAGNVVITAGNRAGASTTEGDIKFSTDPFGAGVTERFRILNNGAWSVGSSGTDTGTAGYVLTTNGASSAPTWQSVSALISEPANQIAYGTGSGIDSSSAFTFDPTTGAFNVNPASTLASPGNVQIFAPNRSGASGAGGSTEIRGGAAGTTSGNGGIVSLYGGSADNGYGGSVILGAGTSYATAGANGGDIALNAGNGGGGTSLGGSVIVQAGTSGGAATAGAFDVFTSGVHRFRIRGDGAWALGTVGTEVGTAGQVITSNGSGSVPTWETVNLANTSGTLPIANGGTGATTAVTALDALSPNTAKGDLIVHNGTNNVRLPVGTNGQILVANSALTHGMGWVDLDTSAVKSSMTNEEGSTITIGQAVFVSSAGNVSLADASGSGEEVVLGLVGVASIANTASGNIVSAGEITTSGLTAGSLYYLSETAGAITTTAPTTAGSWVVPVGIALSTTRFLVRIGVAFQN